jgi:hypothetical protein
MKLTAANKKKLASKEWRMNHLYKIVDKNGDVITFKLKPEQDSFMRNRTNRNIILKARQLGFTTLACIDFLDDCLFNQNINALIIAHKQDQLEVIFRRVQFAWENFYEDYGKALEFSADASRTNLLKFNTGSLIRVALSGRGDTLHRLHVSEYGKICAQYPLKAVEVKTGAFPAVPDSGRITIESTAEGEVGDFHDMFWEAWNQKEVYSTKQYKAFFFPWWLTAEYSEPSTSIIVPPTEKFGDVVFNFKDLQDRYNLTDAQLRWYYLTAKEQKNEMKREYPSSPEEAFESSADKFFDGNILESHRARYAEAGESTGSWTIYSSYNPMHMYVMGADPAEGVGKDSSVAHVIDISHREHGRIVPKVVAVFEDNRLPPDVFAHELKRGGLMYGACLIGVERNGNGLATLTQLKQMYSNLYTEYRRSELVDRPTARLGFTTTSGSKSMILHNLATALREDGIIIPDEPTLQELRRYDSRHLKTLKFDPDLTHHLDRVMSIAIAYEMLQHAGMSDEVWDESAYDYDFDPHAGITL